MAITGYAFVNFLDQLIYALMQFMNSPQWSLVSDNNFHKTCFIIMEYSRNILVGHFQR